MIGNLMNILSILLMLCVIPTALLVYKKKLTFFSGVFLGTFLFLMSFGCSVYGVSVMYGYSPLDAMINDSFADIMVVYSSVPGISDQDIGAVNQAMTYFKNIYTVLLPAIVILSNLFWVYIIMMISKGAFALFGRDVSGFAKFCDLKMPKSALVLSVISYILFMIFKNQQIGYAFLNFSLIIFMICSVCGLSVIDYAIRKKVKISVLRVLIYILALCTLTVLTGIGGTVPIFVGMMDAVFDFRKMKTDKNH